ncbi:MAG TPA: hypothetical protein VNU72_12825, partial [Puia sp.]|nr:hypothetical protein [Puia sp.]
MTASAILTINGGSSSIKFAIYETGTSPKRTLHGKIDRIALPDCYLTFTDIHSHPQPGCPEPGETDSGDKTSLPVKAANLEEAGSFLADWLEKRPDFGQVRAIGHRVVHGMNHAHATIIDDDLLRELRDLYDFDPDHLPGEVALIELLRKRHPRLPQVACFDTAFHAGLPRVARILPIPRRFDQAGVRKYG